MLTPNLDLVPMEELVKAISSRLDACIIMGSNVGVDNQTVYYRWAIGNTWGLTPILLGELEEIKQGVAKMPKPDRHNFS